MGMKLGKNLFSDVPCWIRFPNLQLQFLTPPILSRMASKIGKPLFANSATIQKSRLAAPRILIELHQAEEIISEVKLKLQDETILQQVTYVWHPKPCSICDKWRHRTEECDPELRNQRRTTKKPTTQTITEPIQAQTKEASKDGRHQLARQAESKGKDHVLQPQQQNQGTSITASSKAGCKERKRTFSTATKTE